MQSLAGRFPVENLYEIDSLQRMRFGGELAVAEIFSYVLTMSAPSPPNSFFNNIIRFFPWWCGPFVFMTGLVLAYGALMKFQLGFAEGRLIKVEAAIGGSMFAIFNLYVGARVTAKITQRHDEPGGE